MSAGPLRDVSLESKYTVTNDTVLMNGNQALVRMLLLQRERDRRSGLDTAGFVSGYRGSPLGGFDAALWQAGELLERHDIRFVPGVNEDLAATALTGTQQLDLVPDPQVDGVFSLWYGKGPGVDRSIDAMKHGNYSGAHRNGGVLVVYGDDHPGKSSTVCNQSDPVLASIAIPSLYPSSVAEFIEFGLMGWAMSRYTGLWVGFKCVNETIEQTATCDISLDNIEIIAPERKELPEGGVNHRPIAYNREGEERLVYEARLPLVHSFVQANGLDRVTHGAGAGRLGIVTAGKGWQDTVAALRLLEIDDGRATDIGLSVYKVGCTWPLEPEGLRAFAAAHDELLFIEEKKSLLEEQAAHILYNDDCRPRISGKVAPDGKALITKTGQLDAGSLAAVIGDRLVANGYRDYFVAAQEDCAGSLAAGGPPLAMRAPYFCSGCPHNTSTRVPAGSTAIGGIGCHGMAAWYRPDTLAPLQMGGEGANWIGLAPFTGTRHVFQNLGDGTYYHSGLVAIRAACAANVNITYKILYNDAVAMTGGQPVDGPLSVGDISHQVLHEGVQRCVVVSDNPEKFDRSSGLAPGVDVFHRDELARVQDELRNTPGCTVLIYEQTCAAERRRRRKRGKMEDPAKRLFINAAVCEGCGDCSTQSTCVSILPLETALGRKRIIDQSSCNKDYSCQKGFCPSFVTVYGGEPRRPEGIGTDDALLAELPQPSMPEYDGSYPIMIAGIGGTGVITVGAVLGMAAHLERRACSIYDMTGLSQKNGAVYSHLRIADRNDQIDTQRIGRGEARLVLAFDLVAAHGTESAATFDRAKTHIIGNSRVAPTAVFQLNPDDRIDTSLIERRFAESVGDDRLHLVDATGLAIALSGDAIASNMFTVGYAYQKGLLPISDSAIKRAIELNGVAVPLNLQAFWLGRLAAHDAEVIRRLVEGSVPAGADDIPTTLDEIV
jgi:indolepyruvate ferredoxin oxidoreductase